MPQRALPSEWLTNFSDPYAVLGVSIAADDRRVLKALPGDRKMLHPDRYTTEEGITKDLATQLFARFGKPCLPKVKARERA